MKFKRTVFLTAILIALGVLLGAGAASAAVVTFGDSSNPTKATNIFDLEVDGTLYDVRFRNGPASEIYGPYPGQFPFFNTGTEAEAARDAINSALIEFDALSVGEPVSGDAGSALFNIGFESSIFPIGDVELVTTSLGGYVEATWTALPNRTWEYNQEPSTYAEFFEKPPEPSGLIGGTLTVPIPFSTPLVLRLNSTSFPDPIDEDFWDDGPFAFEQTFPGGTNYDVTVLTQPEGQICIVENGSGDTPADATDVTDILVVCEEELEELDAPPVIRDCPGGSIVGGVYSAIRLTEYEDCVIKDVAVVTKRGVKVWNPRNFTLINSYVKGKVWVVRDNKSLEPSTATLINNVIDRGIRIKKLDEADVRRNAVYKRGIKILDSQSQPDQYAEVFGNQIKGGSLRVNYNLSADVRWNTTQNGDITCSENLVLDANGNEAENGTVECGNEE